MVLYQRGGSLLNRRDGIEVRIEDTSAYGRPIDGTWQEIDDFSGAFAPGSDLMAYLAGARNVREIETVAPSDLDTSTGVSGKETTVSASSVTPDSQQPTSYTRYAFDLNGPELAAYMRDQLEDQLRKQGELPSGVTLDISDQFRDTVGEGEVWIDGRDLSPSRPERALQHRPGIGW